MNYLFDFERFMPHGHCYAWDPHILWTSVISDSLIAAAYTVIPFTLVFQIMRKRSDLPFNWMFVCFGTFIIACGATHVMEIITVWTPLYALSSLIKAVTALASVPTAIILFRIAPKIVKLPTVQEVVDEQKLRVRAEAANEAKDKFIAMVSHELRTPLTPILAGIEILEDELIQAGRTADLSSAKEALRMIKDNLAMERVLIDDLLDLSGLRHGKHELALQPVDLGQTCETALQLFRPAFGQKEIHLAVDLSAEKRNVRGDPIRIRQILNNLLTNALKYTPVGGRLEIRLTNGSESARLTVKDSGCGIEPENLERIFQPFEQLDRPGAMKGAGAGMGLGLSIARALAEAQHGRLTATSTGRGDGTTLTLEFPLTIAQAVTELVPRPPTAKDTKKPQLLLVDDHPDTCRILAQILRRAGYIVETAQTLAEARTQLEKCEVLISDIGLPDGDGCDLMRHFKERGSGAGIAISGFGQDEDIRRIRAAGFAHFFVKPVDMSDLMKAIQHLQSADERELV
jgi:signal transduction histidine kinase/ActR/RegA family two-component response regulator